MSLKKFLMTKVGLIVSGVVAVLILLLILLFIGYNGNSKVESSYIMQKLEESSELTTSKLTYKGFTEYDDTGYDFLTKSNFIMVYSATISAGIDVKEVEVKVNDLTKTVTVKIPKAKILEVKIDPSTIKYYDTSFALFNFDTKQDVADALKLAEEKAREELQDMGLLDMADAQAETLLRGLLQDVIPEGYKLKFEKIKPNNK